MTPCHICNPKIANVRMKKLSRIKILLNCLTEFSSVFTSSFILGIADRLLSGLNNLNVLKAEVFARPGMA